MQWLRPMTLSTETESLAERYARLSREGAERRGVDAALRTLDVLISATVLLIASPVLFVMGAALVYFFFTPMVMWFFLAMQQAGTDTEVQISLLPKVSEYLSLIMTLIFSFGLVFQLPVVTTLMARVGLLTSAGLASSAWTG